MALIDDSVIRRELKDIADYIQSLRREISALQANDLRHRRIPAAGHELAAIVEATEQASNTIMACAEAAMAADPSDPAAYKAFVAGRMTAIFEACAFQDITGQRVAKVVETLEHIEARVSRFADATGAKDANGPASDKEAFEAERKLRLFIHGPPLAGEGAEQDEIDEIIEDGANNATQDDIDRLFTRNS
jgi:chemotaxis protein CheZ